MTIEPEKRDLVVVRVFDAPLEQVWRAWSEPELVMRWWGPTGFTCPLARMEFREGGTSLVCMRAPDALGGQDFYNTWSYDRILPMSRIGYVLRFADKDGNAMDPAEQGLPPGMPREVRHEVAFEDLGNGRVKVTVTEYGWTAGRLMEMSRMGLEQCLDKMAALVARRNGG